MITPKQNLKGSQPMTPLASFFHLQRPMAVAAMAILCLAPQLQSQESAELIVYGATSGGVTAAVEAARQKRSVILISPAKRLGGLTSGGLGWTDLGDQRIVGGLSREFYHRIWKHYTTPAAWKTNKREAFLKQGAQGAKAIDEKEQIMWLFEPSAAEKVFKEMIAEAGVKVIDARLDLKNGVTKEGARITSIRMEDGQVFKGRYFIDATYEGDLMARAGVTYTVGRESNSLYGETLNGIQTRRSRKNQLLEGIDPYRIKGDSSSGLLPGVDADAGGPDGTGDKKVQAYCFRMVLTNVAENRLPIQKPASYNELDFELLFRAIEQGQAAFFKTDQVPNGKTDSNNVHGVSCDFIGMNYDYPEADYATRERIVRAHEAWQRGLVWTLQNHPRVPEKLRKQHSVWGLPKDEFTENGNWSPQLYVREARRMVGETVETERSILDVALEKRSIGMGAYTLDSHNVQRHVSPSGHVRNEGDFQVRTPKPYRIDYGAIIPKAAECENLLVPVAMSASHVAYGSIRMEPVFMILGQSAATAAALALEGNLPVQKVDCQALRGGIARGRPGPRIAPV